MPPLPRLRAFDSTLALLADPYRFIATQCRRLGSDAFEGRLLLQRTVFLHGEQAAELFYDPALFQRAGAAPEPLRATLFGKGTVQSLDGATHRHRKALFIEATCDASVAALVQHTHAAWQRVVRRQEGGPGPHGIVGRGGDGQPQNQRPISLFDIAREVLTRAACAWAGVPLQEADVPRRTRQLSLLFDGAAAGPLQHLQARLARWQAQRWLADVLQAVRRGDPAFADAHIVQRVAACTDDAGRPLPARVAAAELLNLLRPTVAVSVFIVFAAHALHAHPPWRTRLRTQRNPRDLDAFVQEVRRDYPFFPAVVARVRKDFDWQGHHFKAGRRAVLDLYGTNHDARIWRAPTKFRPERFIGRPPALYDFVPQGGGTAKRHHRCPGEGVVRALMAQAVELLLDRLEFEPAPDASNMPDAPAVAIDMTRLPALPAGGFLLQRLRWID